MDTMFDINRRWVEDAFHENWTRFGRLNFVGVNGSSSWQMCQPGQAGIHVFIAPTPDECGGCNGDGDYAENSQPFGCGLWGRQLDTKNYGVRLPQCIANHCGVAAGNEEACNKAVSLHELAHAFAFFHEEERRAGAYGTCPGLPDGGAVKMGQQFGAYDCSVDSFSGNPHCSRMATCQVGPQYDPTVKVISPNDLASIQRAYGRRIRGQVVSTYGRCLASFGDTTLQNGFMWDCDEFQDDQEWDYTFGNRKLNVFNRSDLCLGVETVTQGERVHLVSCSSSSTGILWRHQNVKLRSFGKCMDLDNGNVNGGSVQAWDCAGAGYGGPRPGIAANQKWTVTQASTPEIRFGGPSSTSCLTVPSTGSGGLTVTSCNGGNRQKFIMANADQQIASVAFPTKCIDINSVTDGNYLMGNGLPQDGATIQLFGCASSQYNQKWNSDGELFNVLQNGCMKRDDESNGAPVRVAPCDGSLLEEFDYYPL